MDTEDRIDGLWRDGDKKLYNIATENDSMIKIIDSSTGKPVQGDIDGLQLTPVMVQGKALVINIYKFNSSVRIAYGGESNAGQLSFNTDEVESDDRLQ